MLFPSGKHRVVFGRPVFSCASDGAPEWLGIANLEVGELVGGGRAYHICSADIGGHVVLDGADEGFHLLSLPLGDQFYSPVGQVPNKPAHLVLPGNSVGSETKPYPLNLPGI